MIDHSGRGAAHTSTDTPRAPGSALRRITRAATVTPALVVLVGCLGCSGVDEPPPSVVAAVLVVNALTLAEGDSVQLVAQPVDAERQPVTGQTITWRSLAPAIATVTSTGIVKGVAVGWTEIEVRVASVVARVTVNVGTSLGVWRIMLGPMRDARYGFAGCSVADTLTVSFIQSGSTLSGESSAFTMHCRVFSSISTLSFSREPLRDGKINGSRISFSLGDRMTDPIVITGSLNGPDASGTASFVWNRVAVGGGWHGARVP